MKLPSILLLTGIAAGLMTASCKSLDDEAEAFFGPRKKVPAEDKNRELIEEKIKNDYYNQVNAHIDRRMEEFNEKDEVKLPVFSPKELRDEFMDLSFIKTAERIKLLSMDFTGPRYIKYKFMVNHELDPLHRWLVRTVGDQTEVFTFEPFTNGIPLVIPYEIHILYAFAVNFNRIAESVTIRSYEKLEKGENPAIADLENEANLDKNGNKIDKNFVEIKPKTTTEPLEFRIDNRWCKCYDVKLKKNCEPAVSMSLFVSNEDKIITRVDFVLDDGFKSSYFIDWRIQNGIVLPSRICRLEDNAVFSNLRDDDVTVLLVEEEKALDGLKQKTKDLKKELAEKAESEETATEPENDEEEIAAFANLKTADEVNAAWDLLKSNLNLLNPSLDADETASILDDIRTNLNIVKTKYQDAEKEVTAEIIRLEQEKEAALNREAYGEGVEIDANEDVQDNLNDFVDSASAENGGVDDFED